MTQKERLQRYTEQPELIQELYSSVDAAKHNKAMALKYNFTDTQYSAYLDITGDTILGFYETKDLPNLLMEHVGVPADVANRIVADLSEVLSPVLEREAMQKNPKLGAMKELHQQFAQAGGTVTSTPVAPVASAPAVAAPVVPEAAPEPIHNVTPMRTMAADMNRIHGYGAYRQVNPPVGEDGIVRAAPQDELLKERPRLTNTPRLGE